MRFLISRTRRIDILAAFAGGTFNNRQDLTAKEMYDKTVSVNMTGTYDTFFAVVPIMKEQKSGNIIKRAVTK